MTNSRRNFLKSAIATFATTSMVHSKLALAGGSADSQIRFGLVTFNWGKNWDLQTVIENCVAMKYQGVELRSTHKHGVEPSLSATERKEVRKRFQDSPVEFVGPGSACEYHSPDPAELKKQVEQTKAFIKLSHDCGGTGIKVRPNSLPRKVPVEKTVEQIGFSLREVSQYASEYGQEIRLEIHGSQTSSIPIIRQIMQVADHPQARLCWNCNATDLDGDGLEANFKSVADKIATVHLHDLSQPDYPWAQFIQLLQGINFAGWTLIEEGGVPADIPAAMRENRAIWESLVSKAAANR